MRPIAAVALLLMCSAYLTAQATKTRHYAPYVSCFDEPPVHFIGPKSVKTPVLTSPDHRNQVYAEIEARQPSKEFETCENTATLFVAASDKPFKAEFTLRKASTLDPTMGSLGPAAWSSDSRWLFIESGLWNDGSDCCGYGVVLYDAATEKFTEPDIISAVQRKAGNRCNVGYQGFVGFSAENQIILSIRYWKDEAEGEVACAEGSADWLFDPVSNVARPQANRPVRSRK